MTASLVMPQNNHQVKRPGMSFSNFHTVVRLFWFLYLPVQAVGSITTDSPVGLKEIEIRTLAGCVIRICDEINEKEQFSNQSKHAAMFSLNDSMRYLLYNRPTDMRKSSIPSVVSSPTHGAGPLQRQHVYLHKPYP